MGLKIKSVLAWVLAISALAVTTLYGAIVYTKLNDEPVYLLVCYDANNGIFAWTCGQVLLHASLSPEQIKELNAQAGSQYPVQLKDRQKAEEMLKLFLDRGVDINARMTNDDIHRTALHIVARGSTPEQVALLLKYGARADIADARGKTPLEWAREAQQRYPDPRQADAVRMLEEAERKATEPK